DPALVEPDDGLDGLEGEGERRAEADVALLARAGELAAVLELEQIHRGPLLDRGPIGAELDLEDRLVPLEIALGVVALDDEAVRRVGEDEVGGADPLAELVRVANAGVLLRGDVELVDEERLVVFADERVLEHRQELGPV